MSSAIQNVPQDKVVPVAVRQAASVLILREVDGELEVFIQHRAHTMDFAAGMVVYPGGRVDDKDSAEAARITLSAELIKQHSDSWAQTSLAENGAEELRFASTIVLCAALREVAEETGAYLRPEQLLPWANWITPPSRPKRFDTFFYVAVLDQEQQPQHQTTEAVDSRWIKPADLFAAYERGELKMMEPTQATLRSVMALGSLDKIKAHRAPIVPVPPRSAHS